MDENLVGYLLNALDPATRQEVEAHLQEDPGARKRLDLLRGVLEPLAADREGIDPPVDLVGRTLARVAAHRSRGLPRIPQPAARQSSAPSSPWWRRADVLVAAALLLCASLLILPGISSLRFHYAKWACQNNLRVFGQALTAYSDKNHNEFPNIARALDDSSPGPEPAPGHRAAGNFVPMLLDAGVVNPEDISVRCPAQGSRAACAWTVAQLKTMSAEEFERTAPDLVPCYAYTLGYRDGDQIQGYQREDGFTPILSDSPPFSGEGTPAIPGNSPNHGGYGQNVLFTDGHVEWRTDRLFDGDDIYTNQENPPRVAAGKHRGDHVLGPSAAKP